jgi:hypothetical protein
VTPVLRETVGMNIADYSGYYEATAAVAGSLVGLLFVAITLRDVVGK